MSRLVLVAGLNIALILLVCRWAGIRVNVTSSAPIGLYRTVDASVERGDLVEACLPAAAARLATTRGYLLAHGACGDSMPVIKHVLALEGDEIRVSDHVHLNGVVIDTAPVLDVDLGGRPLEPAAGGTLGTDQVWLISDEIAHSYDSRYFGPISRSAIRSVMRPLWTV